MPDTADHIHQGSCHCGKVRFALKGKLGTVFNCTCSICAKKGVLWHGTTNDALTIHGEAELTLYQFGTRTAKHYFCKHCGVTPFTRSRVDPTGWVVNVRCIDGVDLGALTVREFDGVHWEASAKALLESLGRK